MFPGIPAVAERPDFVTYGPLEESPVDPDVVLLRVNPKQMMVLSDALPDMRIEGKPQCHIVALAKNGETGRQRGVHPQPHPHGHAEHRVHVRAPRCPLAGIVAKVEQTATIDAGVASYAATDDLQPF